ncbi:microsomal triglyceride transfer protein large subunit [Anoplophora glabripennis]|nr:microsomal triglyceride transfer protein large subunit [Anoplophora glabripennis]XP_018566346.1 microsomal triglyceride transfer protein large subunit [Anoplophora glabripennis]
MLPPINSCSILYTLFTWFLGMCYGFVLLSSAAGQNGDTKLFEVGETLKYHLHSTVLLNENDSSSKNVGFYITGDVVVRTVWGNNVEKLLKVEFNSPQLHIKSRKAPSPDGFIPHSSKLDGFQNKPFLVAWNKGRIEKILLPKGETLSLANLKKGIASLFQFQLLDGQFTETDSSGHCTTAYSSLSPTKILKTKTDCLSQDFPYIRNPDEILGTKVHSSRQTEFEFDITNSYLKSARTKETHEIFLAAKEEIGSYVEASQILNFVKSEPSQTVTGEDIDTVIEKISQSDGVIFTQESLLTERESVALEAVISFSKQIDNLRDYLKSQNLGILKPAKAFLLLVNTGRSSTRQDILKALESNKNKKILPQIYDILGYVQTKESHEAATKKLHFDDEDQLDLSERYLWALSFSSQPNPDIIKDLIKKYTKLITVPEKVKETLILTIASMAQRLAKLHKNAHLKLVQEVEQLIINNLEYTTDTARYVFFRALKNLQSESTIPLLLRYIQNGTLKEGVLSFKALKSFDPKLWNSDILRVAERSFFQLDRKYDSSSRTLAADILIESNPSDDLLENLMYFLSSNDPAFEVRQYVFQRIKMIADENPHFKNRVHKIIKRNNKINNYSGLSPRGLSTALKRHFLKSASSNGSLVSIQEIKSGIAKRGTVSVMLDKDGVNNELFSLGIFSGGLNSFLSSDGETDEEEEIITAGMDLTILGTQIRPFVFFEGQGELMGHVWSGTASEKTTAFQALALLYDHLEYIRLGSGFLAELNLKGAISFDLSGKIEISLWNRNAESLVEKSAGIVVMGSIKIDTSFVKSQIEFNTSIEPKLNFQTNIDFSSNVHLCIRLTQPDSLFKHNVFKIERIPGSKHKLRISKYKNSMVSGRTYSINKKNNEMCNAIFSQIF